MFRTPLYDRHLRLSGNFFDHDGWELPIFYTSILKEHRCTREKAGLFDICHMGIFEISGSAAFALLQSTVSRNLEDQQTGQMKLSVLTEDSGGILDDLTVYKLSESCFWVVTNASTRAKDFAWFNKVKEDKGLQDVVIEDISSRMGKLDLQGPLSEIILQQIVGDDLATLQFYYSLKTEIMGREGMISRSGFTGEDGFEIYVDREFVPAVWDRLLDIGESFGLCPVGMGARDTLRLEAGFRLYGREMDESTNPLEVGYGWVANLDKTFIGSSAIRQQKEVGLSRKLVGFEMVDRGIARSGYGVYQAGQIIGRVTSGSYSPTLAKPIGMAFVPMQQRDEGTEIEIKIRDRLAKARVVKLPFYKRQQDHTVFSV